MLVGAVLLTGCARTLEEQAHDLLQRRVESVHEHYLDARARDPLSTGAAALESLDPYGDALASSADGNGIRLLDDVGASVSETEGWKPTTTTASLGTCVEVLITAGEGGDDRGTVRTEAVECPAGTDVVGDDNHPVSALTTDLDGFSADVPEPPYDPPVCISGELCTEGGG
ncbi:hypothetical protein BD833_11735 [Blastococcus xanthinilyticus]|uniref:Uncharacterized protein n=1 Tax=Blastococcus xanthinilyticus TaxID=1564164 RepID=A0A5S5CR52_9ACTN|nr:hypothetical protein BD833_11735 [Blastococcus xanthinilyticus]